MGPNRRLMLFVALLGVLAVVVPMALGAPVHRRGPIATVACKRIAPGVCDESGDDTLPPGGTGAQTTDTVPSSSKEEDTLLKPFTPAELTDFDGLWESVADGFPNFAGIKNTTVRRVLTCAILARGAGFAYGDAVGLTPAAARVEGNNFGATVLSICIQAAVTGQQAAAPSATAAGAVPRCSQATVAVPVLVSRRGQTYTMQASGPITRARGNHPLAISCQATAAGVLIKVRARSHRRLRSIIGSHFSIGYANGSKASVPIHATFTFR